MTKEVLVTIEGYQEGSKEEAVKEIANGLYHYRNGKHYIQYVTEDGQDGSTQNNTLKISKNRLDITRKGRYQTLMSFDKEENTQTLYPTAFGSLNLQIHTTFFQLEEKQEEFLLQLSYKLFSENSPISDNHINISIKSMI